MARLTWLADVLRDAGLDVVEVPGWEKRGASAGFSPTHVVAHHTAAGGTKPVPSLGVVRDGRDTIAGPLCQILIGRDRRVYVIASGKANHAGLGGPWGEIPRNAANSYAVGIEIENDGVGEPWGADLVDVADRAAASILRRLGSPPSRYLAHKEWAPTRKTDPRGWSMTARRAAVAQILTPSEGDPLMGITLPQIASAVWSSTVGSGSRRRSLVSVVVSGEQAAKAAEAKIDVVLDALKTVPQIDAEALATKIAERVAAIEAEDVASFLTVSVKDTEETA